MRLEQESNNAFRKEAGYTYLNKNVTHVRLFRQDYCYAAIVVKKLDCVNQFSVDIM